ncbi:MAG: sigma-70 family RNA polymerase sigma factor [Planctomycetota bacterium]|jgi:RNA polymerase sigma-70 factor (ECF subfamily)
MDGSQPNPGDIAERLRRGEHAALQSLLEELQPLLVARAFAILHDRAGSEDVVQETALKLWDRRDALPDDDNALRGYFVRAVTNAAINELRSRTRRRRTEQLGARPERVGQRDEAINAWECATRLPSELRDVIELRYLEGLTIRETAQRLELPVGTVSTRQRTGLESLRTQLISAGLGVASVTALAGLLGSISAPAKTGTALVMGAKGGATVGAWLKPIALGVFIVAGIAGAVGLVMNLQNPAKATPSGQINQPVAKVIIEPVPQVAPNGAPKVRGAPVLRGAYVDSIRWGDVNELEVRGMDFVTHAFLGLNEDGSLKPLGRFDEYREAGLVDVVTNQGASPLFSIGGVGSGEAFSKVAKNPDSRNRLISEILKCLKNDSYQGVEINWQFPRTAERDTFTALMRELYAAVKGQDSDHLVTFAAGSGYWLGSYDWMSLAGCSDYAVVTAYAWNNPAGGPMRNPGSSLGLASGSKIEASVKGALDFVLAGGYPPQRVIAVLPTFSNANTPWHSERDAWLIGRPWGQHEDYLETKILDEWWTTPKCIELKMSALLDPETTILARKQVIGGVALWELGQEAPSAREMSKALIDWRLTSD